jgi:hypothetical protein
MEDQSTVKMKDNNLYFSSFPNCFYHAHEWVAIAEDALDHVPEQRE